MFISQPNYASMSAGQDDHDVAAGSPSPMDGMAALAKVSSMEMVPFLNKAAVGAKVQSAEEDEVLQPYPFFYYRDYSRDADPDPLYPLVPPGRVPNFAAKMHAILSRPDLQDIIAWMPHGRSWRVLKPRDFEVQVIPQYFDHTKYSSFVRQANGWGFRRITQGKDQGSYFHPKFLRGIPHLCKTMKRLVKSSKKRPSDPNMEPDLFKISELYPVPEQAEDESIMLSCTVHGGPKARMPVCDGSQAFQKAMTANTAMAMYHNHHHNQDGTPKYEQSQIAPSQVSEPTSPASSPPVAAGVPPPPPPPPAPATSFRPATPPSPRAQSQPIHQVAAKKDDQATATPLLAAPFPLSAMFVPGSLPHPFPYAPMMMPTMAAAFPTTTSTAAAAAAAPSSQAGSDGAASFAAGFAAATAFSQQHFSKLLKSIAAAADEAK